MRLKPSREFILKHCSPTTTSWEVDDAFIIGFSVLTVILCAIFPEYQKYVIATALVLGTAVTLGLMMYCANLYTDTTHNKED